MRPKPLISLLAALLLPGWFAAHAVEMSVPRTGATPGSPVPIQVFPLTRVVPKGEARATAFFSYLYPDCSSQGPMVARILEAPRHGTVTFTATDSFPRYAAGSPLAARRSPPAAPRRCPAFG